MEGITTAEAAAVVGIGRATLHRWISNGEVKPPRAIIRDGHAVRLWSEAHLERLRKKKASIYRKGRGRKARTYG